MTTPLYVSLLVDAIGLLVKRPRTVGELIELTEAGNRTSELALRKFVQGLRQEGVVYIAGVRAKDPQHPALGSTVYAWQEVLTPGICARSDAVTDGSHHD